MGVDYTPFVYVGWELTEAEVERLDPGPEADEDDEGPWSVVERIERRLPMARVKLGGAHCYGGDPEYFLGLREFDLHSIPMDGLAAIRAEATKFGVDLLREPVLAAGLRIH